MEDYTGGTSDSQYKAQRFEKERFNKVMKKYKSKFKFTSDEKRAVETYSTFINDKATSVNKSDNNKGRYLIYILDRTL